jgi:hypothetical protein
MDGYGWTFYDPRVGGSQVVNDTVNKLDLTTEFVKMPGGQHGGNWAARVKGRPRVASPDDFKSTVIFYTSMERMSSGENKELECANDQDEERRHGLVVCEGKAAKLGSFNIRIVDSHAISTTVTSSTVQEDKIWQAKGQYTSSPRIPHSSMEYNTILKALTPLPFLDTDSRDSEQDELTCYLRNRTVLRSYYKRRGPKDLRRTGNQQYPFYTEDVQRRL